MISINNLSYSYNKKKSLFKDLNLIQSNGSIIGLLGKNGAGKTTLLKLISGLLDIQKGELMVNGFSPFRREPAFLSDIYFVNDDPFIPSLAVKAYLKVYGSLYKNFDEEKMYRVLQEFDIPKLQNLKSMSYGQQKKFIIAFALSTNCKILLLDEPTNGLDIPSKKVFRKVLVDALEEDQIVVISTHQVKDVETLIDKIVILEHGEIIFNNNVFDVTKKYQFKTINNLTEYPDSMYSEKKFGGYKVIVPINEEEETDMDIELLFNAITNNTKINL